MNHTGISIHHVDDNKTQICEHNIVIVAEVQWILFIHLSLKSGANPTPKSPMQDKNTKNCVFSVLISNAGKNRKIDVAIMHIANQNLCCKV